MHINKLDQKYIIRFAKTDADLEQLHFFRKNIFRKFETKLDDIDAYDATFEHLMITTKHHQIVCCFRFRVSKDSDSLDDSYSAQFYGLDKLSSLKGSKLEIGRFGLNPDFQDPDILRLALAVITQLVDKEDVSFLFGCSSFAGTRSELYDEAFSLLHKFHLAPSAWRPCVKAKETIDFSADVYSKLNNKTAGLKVIPPLLRTYLGLGGQVSDHAVVDRDLNTLHVFTGVDVSRIPEKRKASLRALID